MTADIRDDDGPVVCVRVPSGRADLDPDGYREANPDVGASGQDPVAHFLSVGKSQGRVQAVNRARVLTLRAVKLARIRFAHPPPEDGWSGAPADFLDAAIRAEFQIPDAPPVSDHPYPAALDALIRANPDKLFLDVGAGLRPVYYPNVVNTEIYPSPSTDVLCVGEAMPFASNQFDYVFCFATLEHTRRPWDVAAEICRVARPGGSILIDYPFMQPVHGYPHHYFNATPMGNRSLFEDACEVVSVEIGANHHPIIGVQWMLTVFQRGLPEAEAKLFSALRVGEIVDRPLESLLRARFATALHPEMQRVIASGSLLTAIKREASAGAAPPRAPALARAPSEPVEALRLQNAELRAQCNAMLRSRSWRITAPLRRLRTMLRGSVGGRG